MPRYRSILLPGVTMALIANSPLAQAEELQLNLQGQKGCAEVVQGNVAWSYEGDKRWSRANVERLCAGAEQSTGPARCFRNTMHGGVDWGGGSRWKWQNALALCKGTHNSSRTINCFEQQIAEGRHWKRAIDDCQWEAIGPALNSDESGAVAVGLQNTEQSVDAATGGRWGYLKADSGLCLTLNVFDRPGGRGSKVKNAMKKMFDPREHAKAMAGAAGAGLVFGPGGPELANSVQALRQARKVTESWEGELRHSMGVTLLECGSVERRYQVFDREDRFFKVASGHCLYGKQGQAADNGGRVQLGNCKNQRRGAWYVDGEELMNGRGKCLDVHRPQLNKEGARVQLWECNGAPQQRWAYTGEL